MVVPSNLGCSQCMHNLLSRSSLMLPLRHFPAWTHLALNYKSPSAHYLKPLPYFVSSVKFLGVVFLSLPFLKNVLSTRSNRDSGVQESTCLCLSSLLLSNASIPSFEPLYVLISLFQKLFLALLGQIFDENKVSTNFQPKSIPGQLLRYTMCFLQVSFVLC